VPPGAIAFYGFDCRDDFVSRLCFGFWFCHRAVLLDNMGYRLSGWYERNPF
jgi:hypothetical protein